MSGSNLSIFKVGVGPSSSHTVGPMLAGNMFCSEILESLGDITRISVDLYGSLSFTGKGHLSDMASIMGLNGVKAQDLTPKLKDELISSAMEGNTINLCGKNSVDFVYDRDVIFHKEFLPLHPNGMRISAFNGDDLVFSQVYYSIGGGFVARECEMDNLYSKDCDSKELKYQFSNASELLDICKKYKMTIPQISLLYELQFNSMEYIREYCLNIWNVMLDSYKNGCHPSSDTLPGMGLKRRAPSLFKQVKSKNDFFGLVDYISLYAMAIAEENGAGGRVVTAPTNGACAVIPAVMLYLKNHLIDLSDDAVVDFLLTAMAIGGIYKRNASISGAEAGCQAEIGSASSMAATAMAVLLGASNEKACSAGEIAMEHHLGLTCDPVNGLVQIPCIERNVFGAIKAIVAVRIAMDRDSKPFVHLDDVIQTMYQTGKDMDSKYRETSLGGLAKVLNRVC